MRESISIDSNCYTYLLEALNSEQGPEGDTAAEQIAMLKLYLYLDSIFAVTSTVQAEYREIRDEERRDFHESTNMTLIDTFHHIDAERVKRRALEVLPHHKNRLKDCKILAESELGGADFLLTYDKDFILNLGLHARDLVILKPSELLAQKEIPRGATPNKVPHNTNPLSKVEFWRI